MTTIKLLAVTTTLLTGLDTGDHEAEISEITARLFGGWNVETVTREITSISIDNDE